MRASDVRVESLMSKDVVQIDVEESVQAAARLLTTQLISCVVVVEEGQPVGVVTERDLAMFSAACGPSEAASDTPVSEIMGTPLIVLRESDGLMHALDLVDRRQIRHIPVVDRAGGLAGVLTQSDLLRACRQLLAESG